MREADSGGGERFAGPYRLLDRIGRGGFGEVFLAESPEGTPAAVKLLHPSWASDDEVRRKFAAEVEQARRVSDFCVAAILDADPGAEQPWIASEYIDGPTLHAAVREHGPRRGADLHRLAVSSAAALAAIHGSGVVHRDFKPANMLLAADGPRVIDFGIARAIEATSMTASGIIGTIGYMAPEQLEGGRLTSAVDVFSWGAVLIYAATGNDAFAAPTQAARITRVLTGEPDTGDLDGPLLPVVLACLAKDPARRPSARELLDLLLGAHAHGAAAEAPGDGRAADATTERRPAADGAVVESGTAAPTGSASARAEAAAQQCSADTERPATLLYTNLAAEGASAAQVLDAPPLDTPETPPAQDSERSGIPSEQALAGPADTPPAGGRTGTGTPPYTFAGSRYTDPGALAAAMQRDWTGALRVFSEDEERTALGSWMVDDLGDTVTDRSVYRRRPDDANLAVTWFVAQLRPDLPPVFRGRDASAEGLRHRFADVAPASTGVPTDNELVLVARPEVLRLLALHEAPGAAELRSLADDLATAERAAVGFLDRLARAVPSLGRSAAVDSALIVSLLLYDRWYALAADSGAQAGEWVEALWAAVQREQGPSYVGAAVAAAAVDGQVREIGLHHAESSAELDRIERERKEAADRWKRESRLHRIRRGLRLSPWLLVPVAVAALVLEQLGEAMTAVAVCAVAVSVWVLGQIAAAFVGLFSSSRHGFATAVQAAQARSNRLGELAERLGPEADRLRTELEALRGVGRPS